MSDIIHSESELPGTGGVILFSQAWVPAGPPHGVVVIAHGLAEHSGRYAWLATRLVRSGFAVHALDHRGHGRSPGPRANINRFVDVVADVGALIEQVRALYPGQPVTLLGHSMGGAIAFAAALERQDVLRNLVLSGALLGVSQDVPRLQLLAARILSVLLPNLGVIKLPAEAISRDPVVVRAYVNDPLVHTGAIPARTLAELFAAIGTFPSNAPRLRIPVLALHGEADSLVPLTDVEALYERLGSADRTVKTYPGLFHEVFNEPEREAVFADLLRWLEAHH